MKALVALGLCLGVTCAAGAEPLFRKFELDVPAQSLQSALEKLGAQAAAQTPKQERSPVTHLVLAASPRPDPLIRTNAVKGSMTYEHALERMLAGTGMRVERDSAGEFRIYERAEAAVSR